MQISKFYRFWFIPPVLIALVVLIVAPKLKNPPQQVEASERATTVRVMKVTRIPMAPRAIGYGATKPSKAWEAVAEVSGQVAWLSDQLKTGHIIQQGTELLRIDDASYKLARTQAETQLHALEVKNQSTRASLELEKRGHSLLKKDVERKRVLRQQGALSASVVEEAERGLLKGAVTVQNLKNTLAINNAEREVLLTQKANAELDLQRTHFIAPFDVRITERKINQAQYANKGQLLFSADGLDVVEIEARFPIGKLRPLIRGKSPEAGETVQSPTERSPGALKLDALVRLKSATHTIEWKARVDRVAGVVDPQTQTIGVVVVIDQPYAKAYPGQRPPLVRNTSVEVELRKKAKGKPLVIPIPALHEGKVYLIDQENRLEIRSVKPLFTQGAAAVIAKGLEEGETLVVSNPVPAVAGMLLDPVEDKKSMKRLKMEAAGQKVHKK